MELPLPHISVAGVILIPLGTAPIQTSIQPALSPHPPRSPSPRFHPPQRRPEPLVYHSSYSYTLRQVDSQERAGVQTVLTYNTPGPTSHFGTRLRHLPSSTGVHSAEVSASGHVRLRLQGYNHDVNSVTCSLCLQRTSTSACQSTGWTLCGFISASYYCCPGNSIRASACIGTPIRLER
jgi:hypothetical protein